MEGVINEDRTSDEENESDSNRTQEVEDSPVPPASQHSYFPGASHPLQRAPISGGGVVSSSSCDSTRLGSVCFNNTNNSPNPLLLAGEMFELVIIELAGVVLVPGMTIPLILEEPGSFASSRGFWMLYRQIQDSRRSPGQAPIVQVGILTQLDPDDESDLLTTTRASTGAHHERIMRRRRSAWMRRSFGPGRLRRFSERLIQEMGDIQEFLDDVESVEPMVLDDPTVRDRPRRGQQRGQRSFSFGQLRLVRRQSQTEQEGDVDQADDNNDDNGPAQETSQDEVEFLHRRRTQPRTTRTAVDEDTININNNRNQETLASNDDPYAGRIGTLATVTCTHGDDDQVLGRDNTQVDSLQDGPRRRASLLLTAVGTGRFRIPHNSSSGDGACDNPPPNTTREDYVNNQMRIFVRSVQEWSNERIQTNAGTNRELTLSASMVPRVSYERFTFASVSVWPKCVYDNYWPWTMMQDLKQRMNAVPSLKEILTCKGNNIPYHPFQFSYWLIVNLPLSERERLQVLYCPTVMERLQWFQRHSLFSYVGPEVDDDDNNNTGEVCTLSEEEDEESPQLDPSDCKDFTCKSCQIPIAPARSLFTLGGAEGTVGNYVNEYGVVHATMTVRNVDLNEVELLGQPETKNSWFPGYAWTIMRCALCYAHLGWKFSRANDNSPVSKMRPAMFYGLSATGVTLTTNLRRQRLASSFAQTSTSRRTRQRNATNASVG